MKPKEIIEDSNYELENEELVELQKLKRQNTKNQKKIKYLYDVLDDIASIYKEKYELDEEHKRVLSILKYEGLC